MASRVSSSTCSTPTFNLQSRATTRPCSVSGPVAMRVGTVAALLIIAAPDLPGDRGLRGDLGGHARLARPVATRPENLQVRLAAIGQRAGRSEQGQVLAA